MAYGLEIKYVVGVVYIAISPRKITANSHTKFVTRVTFTKDTENTYIYQNGAILMLDFRTLDTGRIAISPPSCCAHGKNRWGYLLVLEKTPAIFLTRRIFRDVTRFNAVVASSSYAGMSRISYIDQNRPDFEAGPDKESEFTRKNDCLLIPPRGIPHGEISRFEHLHWWGYWNRIST